ncbi:MAG: hypothetical protein E7001_00425 [Coriobacteriaceae bacterium]|nr:hypothetical protein [Coriobacteriaceae bacterium]
MIGSRRWGIGLGLMATASVAGALLFAPAAHAESYVTGADLAGTAASAPARDAVLPNAGQYRYAKEELAAFCHFGPNTFSGVEWGESYGKNGMPTAVEYMNGLTSFDADSYVRMVKDAGFKRLIVTAKHHDGFCIWDSPSTTYDMGSTTSKIDILAELSAACTTYDVDMGLYLSPWDIHDESYGELDDDPSNPEDPKNYNLFYARQLTEILGNDKYGNNGRFVEIWMDGAKGTGQHRQSYDFDLWHEVITRYEGEDCIIFQGGRHADIRWVGNENGLAGDTSWNRVAEKASWDPYSTSMPWESVFRRDPAVGAQVSVGDPDGDRWIMNEADARITTGWFWGPKKKTPKSMNDLSHMYFNSVGHGTPFLLNIPPNADGTVDADIVKRVAELGQNIRLTFADDLTRADGDTRPAATAKATSVWGDDASWGPDRVLDGDDATFWSAATAEGTQSLVLELGSVRSFDVVSFEEAIQNGQRIESFTVSYRDASGAWVVFGEGGTVGAKRLVRGPLTRSDAVKIDVSVHGSQPAQISEAGIFRATRAFAQPSPVPAGMTVIDNTGEGGMTATGAWNHETFATAVGGTSMWTNRPGASVEFTFTGTKFLLLGTKDGGHGRARVYIDDMETPVATIDTQAKVRDISAVLFASGTLPPGSHRVRVVAESRALGIDAAAVLDNGGAGMLEFSEGEITMDEEETYRLGIERTGGTAGQARVQVSFEPGSAVQGDFDTTPQEVVFADGEDRAEVTVRTKRNRDGGGPAGDKQFTVTMTPIAPEGLVLGAADAVTVTIRDRETTYTPAALAQAIAEAEALGANGGTYELASARVLEDALDAARAVAALEAPDVDDIYRVMRGLSEARASLVLRGPYTDEDPVAFPIEPGRTVTVEAELARISNDPAGDNGWPIQVSDWPGASGGRLVDAFGAGDTLSVPVRVDRAGTYRVRLAYMSGSPSNKLVWADASGEDPIIRPGEVAAGSSDASAFRTVEFDLTVDKPGTTTLVFTGPAQKSPRVDKLDISLAEDGIAAFGAIGSAGPGGRIEPAGFQAVTAERPAVFTVTPDEGYRIAEILKNGEAVESPERSASRTVEVVIDEVAAGDVHVEARFEPAAQEPDPGTGSGTEGPGTDPGEGPGAVPGTEGGSDTGGPVDPGTGADDPNAQTPGTGGGDGTTSPAPTSDDDARTPDTRDQQKSGPAAPKQAGPRRLPKTADAAPLAASALAVLGAPLAALASRLRRRNR